MQKYVYSGKTFPVKAQVVGETLTDLYNKYGDDLTSAKILETAKQKNSPIHKCFEWDDKKASNKYRLIQAGDLVRSICVVRKDGDKQPVRSFVSVRVDSKNNLTSNYFQKNAKSFYVPVSVAMQNEQLRRYTLEMAHNDLKNFMEKYKRLEELSGLFTYVKTKVLTTKSKKAKTSEKRFKSNFLLKS